MKHLYLFCLFSFLRVCNNISVFSACVTLGPAFCAAVWAAIEV